ncbi:MAG: hypothetical protein PHY47_27210 [Lachnospiraceae bacterium]|nr:hypothetical protein [Lachnospiraceae bacterium]
MREITKARGSYKPDLRQDIVNALYCANVSRYKESMQSLVLKDIQKCLREIQKLRLDD